MLCWPLLVRLPEGETLSPPFLFLALLPLVIAVVLAEVSEGGLDPRALAILGRAQRLQRRAARAVGRHRRRRAGVLPADPRRPGVRARVRLRARLHVAVRVGAGDRRASARGCRTRCSSRRGSAWAPGCCRAASPVAHEIVMLAAYGVVSAYAFGLLMNLSGWPFVLGIAVPGPRGLAGLRRRRAAGGEPPAVRGLHAADLDGQLRHRPGDHHRRGHRGARPGGAHDVAPRLPPGRDRPPPAGRGGPSGPSRTPERSTVLSPGLETVASATSSTAVRWTSGA